MNLHDFLQAPRQNAALGFTTLTPPDPECLKKPAIRQAVRAVVANKVTKADIDTLFQHWMLV